MSDDSSSDSNLGASSDDVQVVGSTREQRGAQPSISYTPRGKDNGNFSDSDDDSSILEVLPPTTAPANGPTIAKKKPWTKPICDDDSEDSDDSLLNSPTYFCGGGVGKSAAAAAKKVTASNTTSSSTGNRYRYQIDEPGQTAAEKKQAEKDRKQRERQRERERKQAQKAAEQATKRAEREAAVREKKRQKEEDAQNKKRQKIQHDQAKGKHATSEIVCLVDPPIYRRRTAFDWTQHEEITNHNFCVKEYRSALGGLLGDSTNSLLHPPSCHAVQWIRQDHMKGGAGEAWKQLSTHGANKSNHQSDFVHLDRLVMVFDQSEAFLQLLGRTDQDDLDDDYPKLRHWLRALTMNWQAQWPTRGDGNNGAVTNTPNRNHPNILLFLYRPMEELDRQWVEYNRNRNNTTRGRPPPTAEEYHDAITWMLIQYQVECWSVDNDEDLWTQVLKMTRALCKEPYEDLTTELECVKKNKIGDLPENPTDVETAQDVWMRQLQQIHGVSKNKARALVQHYPTIQSLWQDYQDDSKTEEQKRELVAGMLANNRYESNTARRIYLLLTSTNPNEMI